MYDFHDVSNFAMCFVTFLRRFHNWFCDVFATFYGFATSQKWPKCCETKIVVKPTKTSGSLGHMPGLKFPQDRM